MEQLSGYKTYILCGAMLVFATLGLVLDKLTGAEAGTLILEALAIAGLRNGIAKI